MIKKICLFIKSVFCAEREIICVSDSCIRSRKVGVVFLIWNVLFAFWTAFITIKYFALQNEVSEKNDRISYLETNKQELLANISILENNINNIRKFIVSLNRFDRFANIDENFSYDELKNSNTEQYNIELVLDRTKDNLKNINLALIDRINGIQSIKEKLNFNDNIQAVSYETSLEESEKDLDKNVLESIVMKNTIDQNLAYLENLESFVNAMPFSEPININYVSSKFGRRLDPFTKKPKEHHGVDVVGSYMSKIYSPAPGKVIFTGTKGGYGKAIVVQHDYGIKTLYGHLNDYKVKIGDKVKRGDVLGIQGSTGRSTGHHLHYEILKGRDRYSPLEFIKAGSNFY